MRVHHCGICHSDYTALHSTYGASPSVLGHEAAGVVDAVGEGVTMVAPGDKVVLTPIAPCGRCYWCLRDQPGLLREQRGGARRHVPRRIDRPRRAAAQQVFRGLGVGGFAEYAMTQRDRRGQGSRRHAARDGVRHRVRGADRRRARCSTPRRSSRARPCSCSASAASASRSCRARASRARAQIIASDPLDWRRDAAAHDGRHRPCSIPNADDVLAATRDLTERRRRLRVRVRGRRRTRRASAWRRPGPADRPCSWARRPLEGKLELDPLVLFGISEKKLMGCFLGSCNSLRDIPRMVAMWRAGQLDLEALVTARRPLDEINDAFTDLAAGVGIRTVIDLV